MLNLTHINEMKREKTNYLLIIIFSFAYKKTVYKNGDYNIFIIT